ncbi:DUF4256 domain-containing protein [Pedobacter duraquae]|uniref:Uncharacterized protein DUF4256 n=1 Tax=Pedobacter duraquae TaxID=425511 RepID=A0A4R6IG27_9SPHI|nr:DUF4256 domain-containing protein [Pedobacter duraquae]TDO20766.1 uncharacterized protein DUF4256 [Pedobacter duraquae]
MMKSNSNQQKLPSEERQELLKTLKNRFEKNVKRHAQVEWTSVLARLESDEPKLWSLNEMERTGGEPDVVDVDPKTGAIIFYDCSTETPKGRRSICYDQEALDSRKEFKPDGNALEMAKAMGIEILDENQYRYLQEFGEFDLKTSSWILTPVNIRKLGGAIFADRRYNTVFVYHNGASSYYAARAFRGFLKV